MPKDNIVKSSSVPVNIPVPQGKGVKIPSPTPRDAKKHQIGTGAKRKQIVNRPSK